MRTLGSKDFNLKKLKKSFLAFERSTSSIRDWICSAGCLLGFWHDMLSSEDFPLLLDHTSPFRNCRITNITLSFFLYKTVLFKQGGTFHVALYRFTVYFWKQFTTNNTLIFFFLFPKCKAMACLLNQKKAVFLSFSG